MEKSAKTKTARENTIIVNSAKNKLVRDHSFQPEGKRLRSQCTIMDWSKRRLRDHGLHPDLESKSDEDCSKAFSFCETWLKHLFSCSRTGRKPDFVSFKMLCYVTHSLQGGSTLLISDFFIFEILI